MRDVAGSKSRSKGKKRCSSSSSSSSEGAKKKKKSRPNTGSWDSTAKGAPSAKPKASEQSSQKGLHLASGRRVDVHSLKGAAQYNGCEGRIFSGPNDKGRWEVQVDYQCETKTLSLAAENLQPKPSCGWELVVAPLGMGVIENDIAEAFLKVARIRSATLTRDEKGISKGVCLVEMHLKGDAEDVMKNLQGLMLRGRELKIDWSTKTKSEMGLLKLRGDGEVDAGPSRNFKETGQPGAFAVGQVVVLSGLKGAAQFNGCIGTIVGVRGDERLEVEVEQGGEKKTLALKSENLSLGRSETSDSASCQAHTCSASCHDHAPPAESAKDDAHSQADPSEAEPRKRRRASAWEEANSGGSGPAVVDASTLKSMHEKRRAAADSVAPSEPLPPEAELAAMPVKELRRVLLASGVDITGCLEKSEMLEQARKHAAS